MLLERGECVVAIESKCLEYLSPHAEEFSPAYLNGFRDARRGTAWYRELLRFVDAPRSYRWLDVAQLVKHALGLMHTYLRMCGDIAKHHLDRFSVNIRHIQDLLSQAGRDISEQEVCLAVENFFQWFFENIFLNHSSQIAEFLNNIQWAIFHYLESEFRRSYHLTQEPIPTSTPTATLSPGHQPTHRPYDALGRHEPRPPATLDAGLRHP